MLFLGREIPVEFIKSCLTTEITQNSKINITRHRLKKEKKKKKEPAQWIASSHTSGRFSSEGSAEDNVNDRSTYHSYWANLHLPHRPVSREFCDSFTHSWPARHGSAVEPHSARTCNRGDPAIPTWMLSKHQLIFASARRPRSGLPVLSKTDAKQGDFKDSGKRVWLLC